MHLRFASWNVNSRSLRSSHLDFLQRLDIDILALQEATADFHRALVETGLFAWSSSSLSLRPPSAGEGRARSLGCSLCGSARLQIAGSHLLDEAPLPERTLVAHLASPVGTLTACSFHAPPGVNWGEVKPQTFRCIANWLARHGQRTVFGMDANAPRIDHPDHRRNVWWWKDEALLLGADPAHPLRDTLRVYLTANPALADVIQAQRPSGRSAWTGIAASFEPPLPLYRDIFRVAGHSCRFNELARRSRAVHKPRRVYTDPWTDCEGPPLGVR